MDVDGWEAQKQQNSVGAHLHTPPTWVMDVPLGSANRRWPPSSQMCLRSTGGMMVLAVKGTTVSTRLFDFALSRGSIKGLTVVEYSDQTDIFVEDCDPQQRREVWPTPFCLCNHRDPGFKTRTMRMMCAWWAWMVYLNPPPCLLVLSLSSLFPLAQDPLADVAGGSLLELERKIRERNERIRRRRSRNHGVLLVGGFTIPALLTWFFGAGGSPLALAKGWGWFKWFLKNAPSTTVWEGRSLIELNENAVILLQMKTAV